MLAPAVAKQRALRFRTLCGTVFEQNEDGKIYGLLNSRKAWRVPQQEQAVNA